MDKVFRGKSASNCEWLYGSYRLFRTVDGLIQKHFIVEPDTITGMQVIPETVSWATPFTDLNNERWFIGDIVEDVIVGLKSQVVFTDYGNIGLRPLNGEVDKLEYELIDPSWVSTSARRIGNIHDNPELLRP